MNTLKDQVAIVTGAAMGIGYGIAKKLGTDGARVVIVDINRSASEHLAKELNDLGIETYVEIGDVADEDIAQRVSKHSIDSWGRIDILVNNAALGGDIGNIWELPIDEMDRIYRTNLRGVFLFCHTIIPHMLNRNYGRIVNIASIAGKEGNPKMVPYSATKAAVIALTKSVGKELAKTNIRVNCITPAVIQTRMLDQFSKDQIEYMLERIPIGRPGKIDEIADLVSWLSSANCSFSTGAVFDISGGRATY